MVLIGLGATRSFYQLLKQQQSRSRVGVCIIMTNESRESLKKLFTENANKQLSLSTVISTSIAALKKGSMSDRLYAELVGKGKERSHFISLFMEQMPHVTWNGKKKITVVDWVECKDTEKALRAFREYRLAGEIVDLSGKECMSIISVEKDGIKVMESVKLASGFIITVPSRDAEGNYIITKATVKYIPREKVIWGYTETVMNAFIKALEVLENEK